jgi:hypothetical protein
LLEAHLRRRVVEVIEPANACLDGSARGIRTSATRAGPVLNVAIRLFGLVLAAIAVELIVNGLEQMLPVLEG